ncbi:MAG: anaerobic ribonucleoside-triphosphate reductase, partial [Kiritimatiellae bacterium]|nr:anaerobic ribonucleoside-triphosphate reductase [Kiritimatiellia bacterium]
MNIIKRSGEETPFERSKIAAAIRKANATVDDADKLTEARIERIAEQIEDFAAAHDRALSVEEIQDLVETKIQEAGAHAVAKRYIKYRFVQDLKRRKNTTDGEILTLINCTNEEAKQENANKNPTINSVQRDYMAGAVSKDVTKRLLLPEDIVAAHEAGIIHFHDMDYYAQRMHNCDLVNLEDMLQNGTVISGTAIDRPHSFSTACNIATQIIAQVASNQYGGQSISLTHLAPFVQVSREKFLVEIEGEFARAGIEATAEQKAKVVEQRVREEIVRGVQTIQYQVVTLMTTNGQAPFITVYMYLNEARNEQEKKDLAVIIEEMLRQRIQGVKNEVGVYVTPAFPKLIYVLEEDNVKEGAPYWYLTELAAKCTAKRMVPDYISEKMMLELKGDVYTCMGCRSFLTPDRFTDAGVKNIAKAKNYVPGKHRYYGRFNQGVVTVNLVD